MQTMDDKSRMNDSLASQKMVISMYNTTTNECANPQLRNDLLNILKEEHDIQFELFNEMSMRGWYQTTPAEQQKVTQAKQKASTLL